MPNEHPAIIFSKLNECPSVLSPLSKMHRINKPPVGNKQTEKIWKKDLSLYMTCFVAGPAPLPPWQSQAPGYGAPPPPGYPPFHGPPLPPPSDNHWVSQSLSSDLLLSLLVSCKSQKCCWYMYTHNLHNSNTNYSKMLLFSILIDWHIWYLYMSAHCYTVEKNQVLHLSDKNHQKVLLYYFYNRIILAMVYKNNHIKSLALNFTLEMLSLPSNCWLNPLPIVRWGKGAWSNWGRLKGVQRVTMTTLWAATTRHYHCSYQTMALRHCRTFSGNSAL